VRLSRLARGIVAVVFASFCFAIASPAAWGGGRYAYSVHDVLVHKTRLRFALNNLFPSLAPVDVICNGQQPVRLASGAPGYYTIRCTTGLNIPDFIYHLNSQGHEYVTRKRP
jgi:hypothetical protein